MELNNPDFESDDDDLDIKKNKTKSLADLLLNSIEKEKKVDDKKDDIAEVLDLKTDKEEITIENILSEEEQSEILKELATQHLNDVDYEKEVDPAVDIFLEELASTGDIEESYDMARPEADINEASISDNIKQEKVEIFDSPEPEPSIFEAEDEIIINRFNRDPIIDDNRLSTEKMLKVKDPVESNRTSFYDILADNLFSKRKANKKEVKISKKYQKTLQTIESLDQEINTKIRQLETIETIKPNRPEYIPRVEKVTDSKITDKIEQKLDFNLSPEKPSAPSELNVQKQKNIDQFKLSDKEIIALSEKIKIEGVPLKTIYQNKELSFNGLKRIIIAYLRGGNLEKIFKKELIAHQIDFERDPILKDIRDSNFYSETVAPKSVNDLLLNKGLNILSRQGRDITPPSNVASDKTTDKTTLVKKTSQSLILNVFLSLIIISLIVLIIYLLTHKL